MLETISNVKLFYMGTTKILLGSCNENLNNASCTHLIQYAICSANLWYM